MKYTIEVNGKGAECIVRQITQEQRQQLIDGEVESDAMSYDEICESLGTEDLYDGESEIASGVYNESDMFEVIVRNENGNQIWYGDGEGFEDSEYEFLFDEDFFIAEDYQKGNFFEMQIETDKFEPEKLIPIVTSIGNESIEVISGFMYDGQKLEVVGGDTSSKGFTWHII
jgi:hypothetical protein